MARWLWPTTGVPLPSLMTMWTSARRPLPGTWNTTPLKGGVGIPGVEVGMPALQKLWMLTSRSMRMTDFGKDQHKGLLADVKFGKASHPMKQWFGKAIAKPQEQLGKAFQQLSGKQPMKLHLWMV